MPCERRRWFRLYTAFRAGVPTLKDRVVEWRCQVLHSPRNELTEKRGSFLGCVPSAECPGFA